MSKTFNISVISKACGTLPHTLRAWEIRYNLFSPGRDEQGKRIYSESDLKKAVLLSELVKHGHSISSLAKFSIDELQGLSTALAPNKEDKNSWSQQMNSKQLLKYLELYQIDNVSKELQYLRQNLSTKDFILKIILPMMREVGLMVAGGKYTITQEHIMSTLVRDQLSQIELPTFDFKATQITLATPEGNLHELAIIIANILCRSHKFTTRFLGAAHPANCLAEAINTLKTPVVVLGAVTSDSWNYAKMIIPYLTELDKYLTINVTLILGGATPLAFPIFKNIGKVEVMPTFEDFDKYLEQLF